MLSMPPFLEGENSIFTGELGVPVVKLGVPGKL